MKNLRYVAFSIVVLASACGLDAMHRVVEPVDVGEEREVDTEAGYNQAMDEYEKATAAYDAHVAIPANTPEHAAKSVELAQQQLDALNQLHGQAMAVGKIVDSGNPSIQVGEFDIAVNPARSHYQGQVAVAKRCAEAAAAGAAQMNYQISQYGSSPAALKRLGELHAGQKSLIQDLRKKITENPDDESVAILLNKHLGAHGVLDAHLQNDYLQAVNEHEQARQAYQKHTEASDGTSQHAANSLQLLQRSADTLQALQIKAKNTGNFNRYGEIEMPARNNAKGSPVGAEFLDYGFSQKWHEKELKKHQKELRQRKLNEEREEREAASAQKIDAIE